MQHFHRPLPQWLHQTGCRACLVPVANHHHHHYRQSGDQQRQRRCPPSYRRRKMLSIASSTDHPDRSRRCTAVHKGRSEERMLLMTNRPPTLSLGHMSHKDPPTLPDWRARITQVRVCEWARAQALGLPWGLRAHLPVPVAGGPNRHGRSTLKSHLSGEALILNLKGLGSAGSGRSRLKSIHCVALHSTPSSLMRTTLSHTKDATTYHGIACEPSARTSRPIACGGGGGGWGGGTCEHTEHLPMI